MMQIFEVSKRSVDARTNAQHAHSVPDPLNQVYLAMDILRPIHKVSVWRYCGLLQQQITHLCGQWVTAQDPAQRQVEQADFDLPRDFRAS